MRSTTTNDDADEKLKTTRLHCCCRTYQLQHKRKTTATSRPLSYLGVCLYMAKQVWSTVRSASSVIKTALDYYCLREIAIVLVAIHILFLLFMSLTMTIIFVGEIFHYIITIRECYNSFDSCKIYQNYCKSITIRDDALDCIHTHLSLVENVAAAEAPIVQTMYSIYEYSSLIILIVLILYITAFHAASVGARIWRTVRAKQENLPYVIDMDEVV